MGGLHLQQRWEPPCRLGLGHHAPKWLGQDQRVVACAGPCFEQNTRKRALNCNETLIRHVRHASWLWAQMPHEDQHRALRRLHDGFIVASNWPQLSNASPFGDQHKGPVKRDAGKHTDILCPGSCPSNSDDSAQLPHTAAQLWGRLPPHLRYESLQRFRQAFPARLPLSLRPSFHSFPDTWSSLFVDGFPKPPSWVAHLEKPIWRARPWKVGILCGGMDAPTVAAEALQLPWQVTAFYDTNSSLMVPLSCVHGEKVLGFNLGATGS